MMLQILPPDFKYATETVTVNKAEIISSAFVTSLLVLGLVFISFLLLKFFKKNWFKFLQKSRTSKNLVIHS